VTDTKTVGGKRGGGGDRGLCKKWPKYLRSKRWQKRGASSQGTGATERGSIIQSFFTTGMLYITSLVSTFTENETEHHLKAIKNKKPLHLYSGF
jgi:hypothetical protein